MKLLVVYHDDHDGRACAHIVAKCYSSAAVIDFCPAEYGSSVVVNGEYDIVYVLDYSIPPDQMACLLEACNVVWIDHHKSAIEKYSSFPAYIPGIRRVGTAACELTWEYLYPYADVLMYIRLIGDRDVWRWEYADDSMYFSYGLHAEDTAPTAPIWDVVAADYHAVIYNGAIVYRYVRAQSISALQERGFWLEWRGYKVFAINSDLVRSSEFTKEAAPGADIYMMFRLVPGDNGMYWSVSLYSDTVDVAAIAAQYGGGGHKGAAGFQPRNLDFLGMA